MSSVDHILNTARSQLGTVEGRGCIQKYGAFYGMNGVAWCAQFQWWVFNEARAANLIPKTAYTPTFYLWFQGRGQAGRAPRPGALVFYNWPDRVNRIQHVGIVEAVLGGGRIQTIEGNTTSGAAGNQSAGGGVWRRVRGTSAVVGYGYPNYANISLPPVRPPGDSGGLPTLKHGMRNNPSVASLQRFCNAHNWVPDLPLLPPTGNYLDQTKDVVRRAQIQMDVAGSDADGSIVGPRTNAALWQRGYRG